MSAIKYFFEDWASMCSSSNTSSRGFYIAMTVIALVAFVGSLAGFICALLGVLTGTSAIIGFIGFPVVVILEVVVAIWLARQ